MEHLAPLAGDWTIEIRLPGSDPLHGRVTFEWTAGGAFLLERWEVDHPDFPGGLAVFGPDAQHYFDERGVARVYAVELRDGVLTLSRDDPDFAQRYRGTLDDDGRAIRGAWEKAMDHVTWERDFALDYLRAG
jgi:hypothetical protein